MQTQGMYQTPLNRGVVSTEECLFREVNGNALSNGNVGQEHELDPNLSSSDTKVHIVRTSSTRSLALLRSPCVQSVGRPLSSNVNDRREEERVKAPS